MTDEQIKQAISEVAKLQEQIALALGKLQLSSRRLNKLLQLLTK